MGKAMAIAGMVIGGVIALAFALDMFSGFPFGGRVMMMDVGFFLCGAILAYLSWNKNGVLPIRSARTQHCSALI
jgi:hypothetical protein